MKSLQVAMHCEDPENYSDLQVLKSAAGWYVGTIYNNSGNLEPGSRDTDYFATEKDARFVLELLERFDLSSGYKSSLRASKQEFITCTFDSILHTLELNPRNVGYRIDP
jgi:hypothetical protein